MYVPELEHLKAVSKIGTSFHPRYHPKDIDLMFLFLLQLDHAPSCLGDTDLSDPSGRIRVILRPAT